MEIGSSTRMAAPLPAVTCTSQATMLTGTTPTVHGIVANGWHDRDRAETKFWQQSSGLVQAPRVWDSLSREDPSISTANCFWWYAMYASTDVTVTPRPMYPADGRKIPDVWTQPSDLREELQAKFGTFPLFRFWGPGANIESTQWIAQATRHIEERFDPTVLLTYLPHLDYCQQKFGPDAPETATACGELDTIAADLIQHLLQCGRRVMVVNEYGIMPVTGAVAPNRVLREMGLLTIRQEQGREYLDAGACRAFAVPDHQVAHVYLRNLADAPRVAEAMMAVDGIDRVLDERARRVSQLDHDRSGDLILVSDADKWFTHDWWLDDTKAPDWQRTVDIHRKPGYDPRELFLDPELGMPRLAMAWKLMLRKLGFRTLLDVIPLDPTVVKGSHGRPDPDHDPVLWCSEHIDDLPPRLQATAVRGLIEQLVMSDAAISATEA